MAENRGEPIIGMDFGNCNTYLSFISDIDLKNGRMGGTPHDLLPPNHMMGIPSVFFYSEQAAQRCRKKGTMPLPPWCGDDAIKISAKPVGNRVRYLKQHLGKPLKLDDWTGTYDDAIVAVIEYTVRKANEIMKTNWLTSSHCISISYPATYTRAQCKRLIELAEKATLSDGTKVKVVGTIAEPAAAALDYLVESAHTTEETTVLAYDLGGGTFDMAIVEAYPRGRRNNKGEIYYYNLIAKGGLPDLGGKDFDRIMFGILRTKTSGVLNIREDRLWELAESVKIELSSAEEYSLAEMCGDDYVEVDVTRKEFEEKAKGLVLQTVREVKKFLGEHSGQKPSIIILTGAASQMPLIKQELEKGLPEYQGKVVAFRPSMAISYGAARYGAVENWGGPETTRKKMVQDHVPRDIGIVFRDEDGIHFHVTPYIKAGSEIPFKSDVHISGTIAENLYKSVFKVYEAKVENPDPAHIERDYSYIMEVVLERDRNKHILKDTITETRMSIDRKGLLSIEAWDPSTPGKLPIRNEVTLHNLSQEERKDG